MKPTNQIAIKSIAASQRTKEREYWLNKLSGFEEKAVIPYDFNRARKPQFKNKRIEISGEISQRLVSMSNGSAFRLYMILVAGITQLLHKYTDKKEIILGSPAMKQEEGTQFINTVLILKNQVDDKATLRKLLLQVRQTLKEAVEHINYPIETLLYNLKYSFQEDDFPLFDIGILLTNIHNEEDMDHIHRNITFGFTLKQDLLKGEIKYNEQLYKESTIDRVWAHTHHLFQQILFQVDMPLAETTLVTDEEKQKITETFNNTNHEDPQLGKETLHSLVENQVGKTPEKISVILEKAHKTIHNWKNVQTRESNAHVTYKELNNQATNIARRLKQRGVKRGVIAGLLTESALEVSQGTLGILKAGAAYMPISLTTPMDRINYYLRDARVQIILSHKELPEFKKGIQFKGEILEIDQKTGLPEETNALIPEPIPNTSIAYLIYTSGSTGRPKGVLVQHRSIVNTLLCRREEYQFNEKAACLQLFNYAFDGFVTSLFTPIISGSRVIPLGEEEIKDVHRIVGIIFRQRVTHFICVPQLFREILLAMAPGEPFSLKVVTLAGDTVKPEIIQLAKKKISATEIANEYGVTEAAVMSTIYRHQELHEEIRIGNPAWNTQVLILNQTCNLQPIGVPGEMWISGIGIARGYLNNPELTHLRFTLDPIFNKEKSYRTGDLARWSSDGSIEFLGRTDSQVKIRGYRIELGEIETRLLNFPGIKEALVLARKENPIPVPVESQPGRDGHRESYLCAYVQLEKKKEESGAGKLSLSKSLKEYLACFLPQYMIPAYFLEIEKIPLTPNGKIDRNSLPEPTPGQDTQYIPPTNDTEMKLTSIWSEVLGIEQGTISIEGNFFDLGGHSLRATTMVSLIHQEFQVNLPLERIFKHPNIQDMAKQIEGLSKEGFPQIPVAEKREYYELSPAQRRMYILQQMDLTSTVYNIPELILLEGDIKPDKIEKAFHQLITGHPSLRTRFQLIEEIPVQVIETPEQVNFQFIRGDIKTGEKPEINQWIDEFIQPFDLNQAPLIRAGLLHIKEQHHLLVLDIHHIVSDGTSWEILKKEFTHLYQLEALPSNRMQYTDYSVWVNQHRGRETYRLQENYWKQQFPGELSAMDIPLDYVKPEIQTFEGGTIHFDITPEQTNQLRKISQNQSNTLLVIIITLFSISLSRICETEEVYICTPVAGRRHPDLEKIIGMFVNTLCLNIQIQFAEDFITQLNRVNTLTLEALENQDYPFEELVSHLQKIGHTDQGTAFPVMCALQSMTQAQANLPGMQMRPYAHQTKTSKFDMTLMALETEAQLNFNLEYRTDLFREHTIQRWIGFFKVILNQVIREPERKIQEIEILDPQERETLIHHFNKTETHYPKDKTLHALFQEQVQIRPHHISITGTSLSRRQKEGPPENITYEILNKRTNQLARKLRDRGASPDMILGIMVERSIEMMEVILAVLKSGSAYMPIDSDFPKARIHYMLKDAAVPQVVTQARYAKKFETLADTINITENDLFQGETSDLGETGSSKNLAYVVYTSGTTGKSKGNLTYHQNAVRVVKGTNYIDIREQDRILQLSNYAFDGSVFDIFGAFLNGATLVLLKREEVISIHLLSEIILQQGITVFFLTTALFNTLVDLGITSLKNIRLILFGGERVSVPHTQKALGFLGGEKVLHVYGPTETTVYATYYPIAQIEEREYTIPIGKALANTHIYILDQRLKPVPLGLQGEIYIGGDGLARGYLNNQELTLEKFTSSPYSKGERIYKTGDLARYRMDGNIEFLGRIDHQVKIRGFRVEMGEIEHTLLTHDTVKEAWVIERKDPDNFSYLCAFVVGTETQIEPTVLKTFLADTLPGYMVPGIIMPLSEFPLNPNGKVDLKALPETKITSIQPYKAPRNATEKKLLDLWTEVLNIPSGMGSNKKNKKPGIGIHDHFFELGGHSLKATILVAKVQKEFKVNLPLPEVFRCPTIWEQAAYIEDKLEKATLNTPTKVENQGYEGITLTEKKEYYPLSSAQKRLYVQQQLETQNTAYNMPLILNLRGQLNLPAIKKVLSRLIERHESLRTSFQLIQEEPVQRIEDPARSILLPEFHKKTKTQVNSEHVKDLVNGFVRAFDLTQAPLIRVGIYERGEQQYLFIIDMHHIISDGTSLGVFFREFTQLYKGDILSPLKVRYKDYSELQYHRHNKESGMEKTQEQYWLTQFHGELPLMELPFDFPRTRNQDFKGALWKLEIGSSETGNIKEYVLKERITLYMYFLAIYTIFLSRITSQEDVIVGTPTAGRRHVDIQDTVGMFVNTLALRTAPIGEKTFSTYMQELKQKVLKAFSNQDYQFEELVERMEEKITREPGRNPLFDVLYSLQNVEVPEVEIPGISLSTVKHEFQISKFDLTLTVAESRHRILFTFEYRTGLFKRETITRFASYFKQILFLQIQNPCIKLSEMEIISPEEKNRILREFNDTEFDFPEKELLQEIFQQQKEKKPDQVIVEEGSYQQHTTALTYSELNQQSDQVLSLLIAKGVLPGEIIGAMVPRSIKMIALTMGILKSGGIFLYMDRTLPEHWKRTVIRDCRLKGVFITPGEKVAPGIQCDIYDMPENWDEFREETCFQIEKKSINPAYLIYTSGSTGIPKGVILDHRGIINHVYTKIVELDIVPNDCLCTNLSNNFVASIWQTWAPLFTGARLVVYDEEIVKEPYEFFRITSQDAVTLVEIVPSTLNTYLNLLEEGKPPLNLDHLRMLVLTGETVTKELVQRIRERYRIPLKNAYGQSETSDDTLHYSIPSETQGETIPVGKPALNTKAYIYNKYNQHQPIGVSGELCIAGHGLSAGYLNHPFMTQARFIENSEKEGHRLFRTGDLTCWRKDGNIEFLGRMDLQVKVRGFRVELGEIESHLVAHQDVQEAVVITRQDISGDLYLCAYAVSSKDFKESEIKEYLTQLLPSYMIPTHIIHMDKFPLTPSGKIDRKALPFTGKAEGGIDYVPPATKLEKEMVVIWSEVLGIDSHTISMGDNFFELGGHSLKATILVARIHKRLDVDISLAEFFRSPVVRKLTQALQKAKRQKFVSIEVSEEKEYYPVSSVQRRIYFLQQIEKENLSYNLPQVVQLETMGVPLQEQPFKEALERLIQRHESLRTSFLLVQGIPVQKIHSSHEKEFRIEKKELENASHESISNTEITAYIKDFIRPFDLTKAPLLRLGIIKTGETHYILMMDMHHIISDGTSLAIFLEDFMKAYDRKSLPELRLQYRDFSEWHNQPEQVRAMDTQQQYWLRQYHTEPPLLRLPADFERPTIKNFEGESVNFRLDQTQLKGLKELAFKVEATLFMMLLAIYDVFLFKVSGEEDVVVGTSIAGRRHANLEQIIGMFVNALALRNYPKGDKRFSEFLKEVKGSTLEAYDNQDFHFENLVEKVVKRREVSRNPLFDTMFVLNNEEMAEVEIPGLKLIPFKFENPSAQMDLKLRAVEFPTGLLMILEYSTTLFKPETIYMFIKNLEEIISAVLKNMDIPLRDIDTTHGLLSTQKDTSDIEFNF
jgi:tyrocidine synthetase-3